jgi:cell division protein FtsI (penicillin-binding protein 3)
MLQIVDSASLSKQALAERSTNFITTPAVRGAITDVNGQVLATTIEKYTLAADQDAISDFVPITCTPSTKDYCHSIGGKPVKALGAVGVARLLAPLIGENPLSLGAKLNGDSHYIILKKDIDVALERKILALNLSGYIRLDSQQSRAYPNKNIAGPIIGGVDGNNKGNAGIEQMEDSTLTGKDGGYEYERGANGQEIPSAKSVKINAVAGKSLKTTLDLDVQWKAQEVLDQGAKDFTADYGIAVVENIKTGGIVAIADTNSKDAGSPEVAMFPSRAVSDIFEPGSTAKVITCSELLDLGLQTPLSPFSVPSAATIGGQNFSDAEEHGVEQLTLTGVLAQSSNVGTLLASNALADQQKYDYLKRFGIGDYTGIGLPGESRGMLADYKDWDGRTKYTVLFGQGVAANALQATNVFATIANGGMRPVPHLIEGSTDAKGKYSKAKVPAQTSAIKPETSAQVLKMMEATVTNGIISGVVVPGYRIAGKTGTSQMADSSGGISNILASFIGVFPADHPKYAVSVFYMNPHGAYFGALSAAPVATKIMNFLVAHDAIQPSDPITDAYSTKW